VVIASKHCPGSALEHIAQNTSKKHATQKKSGAFLKPIPKTPRGPPGDLSSLKLKSSFRPLVRPRGSVVLRIFEYRRCTLKNQQPRRAEMHFSHEKMSKICRRGRTGCLAVCKQKHSTFCMVLLLTDEELRLPGHASRAVLQSNCIL